jgi:hypothetical protein
MLYAVAAPLHIDIVKKPREAPITEQNCGNVIMDNGPKPVVPGK